ncbi:MAG: hypothetical protein IT287_02935 [Bdellovibrionaceae bacterium]|nr:hypothetical protein [Pseudobdellovibrionaceae bacterium]
MKKFVWMGLMVFTAPAIAIEDTAIGVSNEFIEKKIHKGDWSVGGDLALSYTSMTGAQVSTSMDVQKFLWDGVSVGLVGRYVNTRNYDFTAIGGKATYHFLETDKMTFYTSGDITYNRLEHNFFPGGSTEYTAATVAVGINYFLTPHIAIGPKIQFTKNIGVEDSAAAVLPKTETSVLMGFTLFF